MSRSIYTSVPCDDALEHDKSSSRVLYQVVVERRRRWGRANQTSCSSGNSTVSVMKQSITTLSPKTYCYWMLVNWFGWLVELKYEHNILQRLLI